MKKFVKILAALAVSVAAFAFVSCADGAATPSGTIADGTYNIQSFKIGAADAVEAPAADAEESVVIAFADAVTDAGLSASIIVSDNGTKVDGMDIAELKSEMKDLDVTLIITNSGDTITIYQIHDEEQTKIVYKKA
ncbi:MAG: hypothetical protein IKI90_03370 [Treponema sp.]|nr:hypothetical protein [Treponema sp.]